MVNGMKIKSECSAHTIQRENIDRSQKLRRSTKNVPRVCINNDYSRTTAAAAAAIT